MGRKLTVYLINGTQHGPRTVDIGNWSGKAIYSPRSAVEKVIDREELSGPGVYILKSDPGHPIYNERVYIGEAEHVNARVKQHLADGDKDFKEVACFTSANDLPTKSHVRYLESRLIQIARDVQNSEIDNSN